MILATGRTWKGKAVPVLVAFSLVGCGNETGPEPSTWLEISVRTIGIDFDPDGYLVLVDGSDRGTVGAGGTLTVGALSPGRHVVELLGTADNCLPSQPAQTVFLIASKTSTVAFEVTCTATSGVVAVAVATHGGAGVSVGYSVVLDGASALPIGANGVLEFTPVGGGAHTVDLGGLPTRCAVDHASRSIEIDIGGLVRDTATVVFDVWCDRPTTRMVTRTSGEDLDADGYRIELDCELGDVCPTWYLAANDTALIDEIPAGQHTLTLEGLAPNCTVDGGAIRTLEVLADTVEVVYSVACAALGFVRVATITTGTDLDADGYRIATHDGWRAIEVEDVPVSGSVTTSGIAPRQLVSVELEGVSYNCESTTPNPAVVTVTAGAVVDLTFEVTCRAAAELVAARSVDGDVDVYAVRLNDALPRRITHASGFDGEPTWSPDGGRIAFVSDRHGKREIFVMDADGSGATRLTSLGAGITAADPAWSPDGLRIACTLTSSSGSTIAVMSADGSGLRTLTPGESPSWSPDGSQLVFSLQDLIRVIRVDGSTPTTIGTGRRPVWSPDGSHIAYEVWLEDPEWAGWYPDGVWVMGGDGSHASRLWVGGWGPAWSPDGLSIAFQLSDRLLVGALDGSASWEVGQALRDADWRR